MLTTCIDPHARICLLRHLHALRHGLDNKPCHSCETASETVSVLREIRSHNPPVESAAPSPADQPVQVQPKPQPTPHHVEGLDLDTLRKVIRPVLQRQAMTGQKSVYLERLQNEYNSAAHRGARITGKKRFREAVERIVSLNLQGAWLLLDGDARSFCMGSEGPLQ